MNAKRAYGDYQTPTEFADEICKYLKNDLNLHPSAVLEPTCGIGNLLKSSLALEAKEYCGIELNPDYCRLCRQEISDEKVNIVNANVFDIPSVNFIHNKESVLVLGNPPWANSSTLSSIKGGNLPTKTNFKGINGIEAITGSGDFDICEYIILKFAREWRGRQTTIAMLCKSSVARNIFQDLKREEINFSSFLILNFDSNKVFGVSTSACLLVVSLSKEKSSPNFCNLYDFKSPEDIKGRLNYNNGQLFNALKEDSEDFEGTSTFEWRQGLKHDCSEVMELIKKNEILQNSSGKKVEIEKDLVFPLIKSSMFKSPLIHSFSRYVLVTQKKPREETWRIETDYPKTWQYLEENKELFEKRKSSIYSGAPPFSIFGVGRYSFAKYKVGVSGFYKNPLFSLLYSKEGKAVMLDDTCYFISFDRYDPAYVAMLLLNSKRVQTFLKSITFLDSKRPWSKKVLKRIDFKKITETLNIKDLQETEQELNLSAYITSRMYDNFKASIA